MDRNRYRTVANTLSMIFALLAVFILLTANRDSSLETRGSDFGAQVQRLKVRHSFRAQQFAQPVSDSSRSKPVNGIDGQN